MCIKSRENSRENCCTKTTAEIKCCCVKKEYFQENKTEIRRCITSLRKKADYIESKLAGK